MAGTIVVDRIESDASYASTINVAGQITFSNTINFGVFAGTAPVAGMYLPTTNNLAFTTASTERMRIDSSGNVGIGTSSPTTKLDNTGSFRSTGATDPTSGTGLELSYRSTYGDVLAYNRTSSAFVELQIRGAPIIFGNAGGERMRIDSSGIVGMGSTDTSNTTRLKLTSTPTTNRATSAQLTVQRTNASTQYEGVCFNVGSARAAYILRIPGSDDLTFGFDAGSVTAEAMRLKSNGQFLVNATTDVVGNNPPFIVNGTGWSNCSEFRWTGTTSFYNVMVANGNGFLGGINTSGSTTTYVNLSDYRVKENINPMLNALEKVALLKPCIFTYKTDGTNGQGFIAHELQEVFPDAVVGEKDAVDANGKPIYQGVDTSFLVATLTAAIQEQQALITSLTARITALESN